MIKIIEATESYTENLHRFWYSLTNIIW
jgi:hypothetical protein